MSRIRLLMVGAVLALAGFSGCQSNSLVNLGGPAEEVVDLLPPSPTGQACPPTDNAAGQPPEVDRANTGIQVSSVSTVAAPEARKREISLAECIAVALENGRTGEFFERGGAGGTLTPQTTPGAVTDSIQVFAFDSAILGTFIDESLAKFDAVYQASLVWNRFNEAPAILPGSVPSFLSGANIGAFSAAAVSTEVGGYVSELGTLGAIDLVQFRSELLKPLPTGGVAGITFRTDFENLQNPFGVPLTIPFIPTGINPTYRPAVDLTLEQPLLRGAGVAVNQLRDVLPGSLLHPTLPAGGRAPGILLARIAHDEAQTEFERRVQLLLFTVEEAYWQLYCAYWDLYSRESGMKQTLAAWEIAKKRYAMGGVTQAELAQIEEQFHSFRRQRLAALGRGGPGQFGVLEAERRLRYVIGLPPEDGTRLIPADAPRTTPVEPNWNSALTDAMARRPELRQIHQELQAAQLALERAADLRLPDLRFIGKYDLNGLGQNLGDALENFEDNGHSEWELGLLLQVPLGFREGNSEVARARLQLAQRYTLLRDQEAKIVFSLQRSYRDLVQYREEIQAARSQEQAAAVELKDRYEKFKVGRETIDLLLRTQRTWVDALREENIAICSYNVALADFERQKGSILQYDDVTIADGPLPACAQARASAHIREWHRSIVLKKAVPDPLPGPEPGDAASQAEQLLEVVSSPTPSPVPQLLEQHKDLPNELDRHLAAVSPASLPDFPVVPQLDQPMIRAGELGGSAPHLGFTPLPD